MHKYEIYIYTYLYSLHHVYIVNHVFFYHELVLNDFQNWENKDLTIRIFSREKKIYNIGKFACKKQQHH